MSTNPRGRRMVAEQLRPHGITDERVLAAMEGLRREEFVPDRHRRHAYADHPIAIGAGQTISQPLVVAAITQAAGPRPGERILEVGAGSGYQAAVLALLCDRVVGLERDAGLAAGAAAALARVGIDNAEIHHAEGWLGWPAWAPFDAIVVSAAAGRVPPALVEQLADGGRMVIPLETGHADQQDLMLFRKSPSGLAATPIFPVRFVPLIEPGA